MGKAHLCYDLSMQDELKEALKTAEQTRHVLDPEVDKAGVELTSETAVISELHAAAQNVGGHATGEQTPIQNMGDLTSEQFEESEKPQQLPVTDTKRWYSIFSRRNKEVKSAA